MECDWCKDTANNRLEKRVGSNIYIYACPKHLAIAEQVVEKFSKRKIKK